jgi:Flp pilus assembly protein CpaB
MEGDEGMKKLIVVALIIATIMGFGVYYFAKGIENEKKIETASVVVAIDEIPKNTIIENSMVELVDLPKKYIQKDAILALEEVVDRITMESIKSNEQIVYSRLIDPENNNNNLSASIPQNYRALAIQTDNVSGIAGNIGVGDRVDLVAILLNAATGISTEMIAENLEVVTTGVKGSDDGGNQYTVVTVLVLDQDILKVTYALSEGKYRLVLRSIVDEAIINPSPYSR